MLRAERVSLVYDEIETTYAVCDVSCQINAGEFIGLVGPSGSGKSSLLYLLGSLKRPTEGTIWFGQCNLSRANSREIANLRLTSFGFVFQHHFLVPHLTAFENIMLGMCGKGSGGLDRVRQLLRLLEIEHCADKFPGHISGGQRQRVAVARALVHRPKVVFADEPTSAVDRRTAQLVMQALRTESEALVVCTHDLEMVNGADRWLVMRDGHLAEERAGEVGWLHLADRRTGARTAESRQI